MKLFKHIFLLATTIMGFSVRAIGGSLENADLIFVVEGNSRFSEAISESTAIADSTSFVHVGIVAIAPDSTVQIIEAVPQEGVRLVPFKDFLLGCPVINDNPAVVIKRLNADFSKNKTVENAMTFLGQPYDWSYLPDNGKIYCSELIYESFRDNSGEHLFESSPMNFLAPDGTLPEFWETLFTRLGEPIPQGVRGTNPNTLARDTRLKTIMLDDCLKNNIDYRQQN